MYATLFSLNNATGEKQVSTCSNFELLKSAVVLRQGF